MGDVKVNVLVLDDKNLIVKDVIRCVENICEDSNCIGFNDELEAIEFAKKYSLDIAILDIDMPNMNGIDVAQKLTEIKPDINIIFLTGHKQYAVDSYKVFASAFLLKPVNEDELKKAFENLRYPVFDIKDLDAEKIGPNITKYRKKAGISIEKLAQSLNCSYQTIYRWEKAERTPDLFTLVEVAKALDVRMDDLLK